MPGCFWPQGSETYTFPCGRWLARDEDDGSIIRELVPQRVVEEFTRKDGSVKKKEKEKRNSLKSEYEQGSN